MLDEEIDLIARRLTNAKAPADLRTRVLARITSPGGDRRSRMPLIVRAAAAGAVAALLIIAFVTNWNRPSDRPPTVARSSPQPAAPQITAPARTPVIAQATGQPTNAPVATKAGGVRRAQTFVADARFLLPDAAAIESIQLVTLAPEPSVAVDLMTTGSLDVEDLTIAPLENAPLAQ